MNNSKYKRMTCKDISSIVIELDQWALGRFGSKLTWSLLEDKFGFSRQSLQSKSTIKAAYDNAKRSLSSNLVKSKQHISKKNEELNCQISRLQNEIENFKRKELQWNKRWQRIAFHLRQSGTQMYLVDKEIRNENKLPNERETSNILQLFDKEIPSSGRD